jgi:hypothetical protein
LGGDSATVLNRQKASFATVEGSAINKKKHRLGDEVWAIGMAFSLV